jgi:acyl-CoA synthetase (AMP-forming)/AMP-acid ligase II
MVHARDFSTLLEMIAYHARLHPQQRVLSFGKIAMAYGELWGAIESFAGSLLDGGLERGDRVVLALPNGPGFLIGFYGAQRAGGIAVPVAPESGVGRVSDLAALCDAAAVVVADGIDRDAERALAELVGSARRRLLTLGDGLRPRPAPTVAVEGEDIAFLQYTSGSTGDPKGVMLTHTGLLTNMDQMIAGMGITKEDSFVSWLPVHHDMGLILMTMVPMLLARPMVLMPTSVRSIRSWMATVAEHRATFTAAPDFAYRLAVRYLRGEPPDVSTLRVALNAAEPVRAGTVEDFERAFGLDRVMAPAYGLAEATVGVSMWGPGEAILTDDRGCVSIGRPFPDIRIRIENEGGVANAGELGEIIVSSPANTRGYWNNEEATRALLRQDGSIRTGDLGYLDRDGNLFIVSRLKNIIIQAGRNIAPGEVEEEVEKLNFVRRAAAVGIDRGGTEGEQMWIFVEPNVDKAKATEAYDEMVIEVVSAIHARLGMRPGRVNLLEPRTIPMTPNGKLKHAALRDLYLDGSLRAEKKILHPLYFWQ